MPQRPAGPGRPDATAKTVVEGRLRAGDDGHFSTVDRKKDLTIRGGFNIHPRKIEAVLYEHPSVAEELRASVRDPVARRTRTRARPGSSTPSRKGAHRHDPQEADRRSHVALTRGVHPAPREGGRVGGPGMFVKPRIPGT